MKISVKKTIVFGMILTLICSNSVYADPLNKLEAGPAEETETEIETLEEIDNSDESATDLMLSNEEGFDLSEDSTSEELTDPEVNDSVDQSSEKKNTKGEEVSDGVYKGFVNDDGTVTVTGFVDPSIEYDEIYIPAEIDGKEVTVIDDGAFFMYKYWVDLIIPDTVTRIGDMAFYDCYLNDLTLGAGVKTIGNKAFAEAGLEETTLIIPDSVKTIGDRAFYNCYFEGGLIIPDSVITIGDEAFKCDSDEFGYGSSFTRELVLGKSVRSIGKNAFEDCGFCGDLIIPNSVVTIGDHAFEGCDFSGSLSIGNKVKTIGEYAFSETGFKGNLKLGKSVEIIGDHAFENCASFSGSLKIGNKVKTIGKCAFKNTGFRGRLKLGKSVETIGEAAFYSTCFTGSLTIPDSVTTIGASAFQAEYYDGYNFTGKITLGKNIKTIGFMAFYRCFFKGTLSIPDKVTKIGPNAFYYCEYLEAIKIPKSVKRIGDVAFDECTRVRKVTNNSSVSIPAYWFMEPGEDEYFVNSHGRKVRRGDKIETGIYTKNPVTVKSIHFVNKKSKMFKGEKVQFEVSVSPTNAFNQKVSWKSSNPKIASVSKKGVVKGLKAGTAIITATARDGSKKSAKCKITIKNPIRVKNIMIEKATFVLEGRSVTLEYEINPSDATNKKVTWESSDPTIATVSPKGVVEGISPGVAYITVTTVDGNKTATCMVTVK